MDVLVSLLFGLLGLVLSALWDMLYTSRRVLKRGLEPHGLLGKKRLRNNAVIMVVVVASCILALGWSTFLYPLIGFGAVIVSLAFSAWWYSRDAKRNPST